MTEDIYFESFLKSDQASAWEENKIWTVKLGEFLQDRNKLLWQLRTDTTTNTILHHKPEQDARLTYWATLHQT